MPSSTRGCDAPAVASTSRASSCTAATPRFPPPALRPSAQPLRRSGKKALMLVIDDAKLPPPTPAMHATMSSVLYETPGFRTIAAVTVGTSSNDALTTVQFRPPKVATANVYGNRTNAPSAVGIVVSKNFPAG